MSSGPFNLSNNDWGGVFGSVVIGKYQMSLTGYGHYLKRSEVLDWCGCHYFRSNVLAVKSQQPPLAMDYGFFIRPFHPEAWFAILGLSIFTTLIYIAPYTWIPNLSQSGSRFIIETSWWFFFVGIYSYHTGAMTMFFTKPATLHFSSMQDVLNAYPGNRLNRFYFSCSKE